MDNDRCNKLISGENGTLEFRKSGENLLDLFFKMIRGMSAQDMEEKYRSVVREKDQQSLIDLFVLCFQTRDCRGGKGERALFVKLLILLAEDFPVSTSKVIPFIAQYGYYKDYWNILEELNKRPLLTPNHTALRKSILEFLAIRLKTDSALVERAVASTPEELHLIRSQVSLCAKYMPRQNHAFCSKEENKECLGMLLEGLFPDIDSKKRKELYRKMCANICRLLDVVEQKMCRKRYSEIDFSRTPSVCTKKYQRAFLNENVQINDLVEAGQRKNGNRFPDDPDRVECRRHFITHITSGKVKGGQLHPHEIVSTIHRKIHSLDSIEQELLNCQWKSMKESLLQQLQEAAASDATGIHSSLSSKRQIDLGNLVPLSDVSGSMTGTPMLVSIALGILISETTNEAFRNRVLTFESNPDWCVLPAEASITEKVRILSKAPWGGSTNLEVALDRIVEVCENNRLPVEAVPDLIIFSDMQFDEAMRVNGRSLTQFERIEKKFHDLGMKIVGTPYPAPRVIFWNLRANTPGFPTESTTSNVQLLSGYSPSLLKAVLMGEEEKGEETTEVEDEETGVVVVNTKTKKSITPHETLRRVLDDNRYDDIRQCVVESQELEHFVAP